MSAVQVITVANSKGGCGKTVTSMCLALEAVLGRRPRRVLCLDADPQASLLTWAEETERRCAAGAAEDAKATAEAAAVAKSRTIRWENARVYCNLSLQLRQDLGLPPPHAGTPTEPPDGPCIMVRRYTGKEPIRADAVMLGADLVIIDCKLSTEAKDPERGRNALRAADIALVPTVPAQIDLSTKSECEGLLAAAPGPSILYLVSRALKTYAEPARNMLVQEGHSVLKTIVHERPELRLFASASTRGVARRPVGLAGQEMRQLLRELDGRLTPAEEIAS